MLELFVFFRIGSGRRWELGIKGCASVLAAVDIREEVKVVVEKIWGWLVLIL